MRSDQAWTLFLWAALGLVLFAGFWAVVCRLTRGGMNWGHDEPPPYPKADDSEQQWLDSVDHWKARQRA